MQVFVRLGLLLGLAALAACGSGGEGHSPLEAAATATPAANGRYARSNPATVAAPPVVEEVLLDDGFRGLYVNGWMDLGAYGGSVALGMQENTGGANWAIGSFPKWIVTQGCVGIHDRLQIQFGDPTPPDWCVDISGSYQGNVPAGLPRTGTLELRDPLQLLPGTYRLMFDLGPPFSQGVLGVDRCVVSVDRHFRETFAMAYNTEWKTISRTIRVCEPTTTKIRFSQTGPRNLLQPDPDSVQYYVNYGCRIDNVRFEKLAPELAIDAVEPAQAGNVGSVHMTVQGSGFPDGVVTALLRATGVPDISAPASSVECGASVVAAFDLRGAPPGVRDVVLMFAGGQTVTLSDGFTVDEGGGPDLWVSITGASTVRAGRLARFGIVVTNHGNVDSDPDTILLIRPPAGTTDGVVRIGGESIPLAVEAAPGGGNKPGSPGLAVTGPLGAPTGAFTLFSQPPGGTHAFEIEARMSASGNVAVELYRPVASEPRTTPDMWRRFYDRKAEEIVDEHALALGSAAEDILSSVWGDVLKRAMQVTLDQQSAGSSAMHSLSQGSPPPPGGSAVVSAALCQEGLDHFRDWYSASEFALWTSVCALEQLREAFIQNTSEPLHGELGEAIAHYDRVNREMMQHRPEMASMSVGNWLADSLLKNTQKTVKAITVVQSGDPNQKSGCVGFGPDHAVSSGQLLQYRIDFENVPTATAPAATVEVTDVLDTTLLDPDTVQFLDVGFGSHTVTPAQSAGQFNTMVDLRPSQDLLVSVEGTLDVATGRLHWKFTTLDPATEREPTNALLGFLPANQVSPQGEGHVTFSVMPRATLGTGATIRNKASIVFDFNAAIETPEWSNTVDGEMPQSAASALTPQPGVADIPVSWSGTDDSSGILDYRVYASMDGGPYVVWQEHVATTSAVFHGTPGHTYRFYSVARDQTGNVESKIGFDAEVALAAAPTGGGGGGGAVGWEVLLLAIGAAGRALVVTRRRRSDQGTV